ncbi:hypothetical protein BpHYR1_036113 [Brachionus plicatilis]|uniref:Uncharacterized protein n=1 Tax=Brachionus plicatilis TaxID=10195 RepID=A0A3M7S5C3_BRAPC|nr:hypothetical protein BpHYR1_036113 [Brachionus plicatilis]
MMKLTTHVYKVETSGKQDKKKNKRMAFCLKREKSYIEEFLDSFPAEACHINLGNIRELKIIKKYIDRIKEYGQSRRHPTLTMQLGKFQKSSFVDRNLDHF